MQVSSEQKKKLFIKYYQFHHLLNLITNSHFHFVVIYDVFWWHRCLKLMSEQGRYFSGRRNKVIKREFE